MKTKIKPKLKKYGDGGKPSFEDYYKTLPKEKSDTSNYNLRAAYNTFPYSEMQEFAQNHDKHLTTVGLNKQTGNYDFFKSKDHPTLYKELDWYNSNTPESNQFRKEYNLDTTGNYYKYTPVKQNGGRIRRFGGSVKWSILDEAEEGKLISADEFRPKPLANSNQFVQDNIRNQSIKGSLSNPINLPEQVLTFPKSTTPTWQAQQNRLGVDQTPIVGSGDLANAMFVEPMTQAISIPSHAVASVFQGTGNLDFKNFSKSGRKLDELRMRQGLPPIEKSKDNTSFFDNNIYDATRTAMGIKSNPNIHDELFQGAMKFGVNTLADPLVAAGISGDVAKGLGMLSDITAEGLGRALNTTDQYVNSALDAANTARKLYQAKPGIENVDFIKPDEQQYLHTIRNIGSNLTHEGMNSSKALETIQSKSSILTDSQFESLTGFKKSELPSKIEEVKNAELRKKEIADVDAWWSNRDQVLGTIPENESPRVTSIGSINLNPTGVRNPRIPAHLQDYASRFSPDVQETIANAFSGNNANQTRRFNPQTDTYQPSTNQIHTNVESGTPYEEVRDPNIQEFYNRHGRPNATASDYDADRLNEEYQHAIDNGTNRTFREPNSQQINNEFEGWARYLNGNELNLFENTSIKQPNFFDRLNKSLNTKLAKKTLGPDHPGFIPQTEIPRDVKQLIPSISAKGSMSNIPRKIIQAVKDVEASPKGTTSIGAHSLSTDSYPASLKMLKQLLDRNVVDVNFHGYEGLNSLGFSDQVGVPKATNMKEINTLIKEINSHPNMKQRIPYAELENHDFFSSMRTPKITITRKKLGGLVKDKWSIVD